LSGKHVVRAVALALAVACLTAGTGCESSAPEDSFELVDGSLQGELAIYIADDLENGVQRKEYAIRASSGEERPLDFDADPGIEAGTRIRAWGNQLGERLRVTNIRQIEPATRTITSELRNGMKYNPKRLALILLDIGAGTNLTPENALREIVGPSTNNDPPLRNYYAEASYGTEELDGRVFGPFPYSLGDCNYNGVRTMFKSMVDSMGGGTFNHYLWYFGSRTSVCGWSGLGAVGTPASPARDTWYNGSSSCVVMIQEPGHNFGMQHSSSMDCGSVSFHDTPQGNCSHSEYGDAFDPMGGGCRHTNGWQKAYQGWTQGCNMVRVRSSGTFTLLPLELPCDGAQVLQIPMPKTRMFMRSGGGGSATNDSLTHYYLELRTKRGVDASLTTSVHVRVSGNFRGRTQSGLHTWILDMDPSTSTFNGLLNGQTFNDPAGGVSFTVAELDESHATIQVTMSANGGGPTCLDTNTPFEAPGPGIDSCSAGIAVPSGSGGAGGATGTGGAGGRGGTGGGMAGTGGGSAGRGGTGGGTAGSGGGNAGRGGTGGGTAGSGGGNAGRGGTGGGTAGAGGAAGTGAPGAAGATGTAGNGAAGATGGGATAGTTGAAGSGNGGTGGVGIGGSVGPGAAGTSGTAGDNGTTGSGGGIVTTGAAGVIGIPAGQGGQGGSIPGEITGGCSCETSGGGPPSGLVAMLAFAGVALGRARRGRGRSRTRTETAPGGR
jgi:hypothetical protein